MPTQPPPPQPQQEEESAAPPGSWSLAAECAERARVAAVATGKERKRVAAREARAKMERARAKLGVARAVTGGR